jgi:hypothetical protein
MGSPTNPKPTTNSDPRLPPGVTQADVDEHADPRPPGGWWGFSAAEIASADQQE